MAGIEFKGMDQLKKDVEELETRIGMYAMIAAEDAAAKIFETAIYQAVPHKTGQLASAVVIIDKGASKQLTGGQKGRRGLYVGIEKKKGYYGFFLDKGFTAMGRSGRRLRRSTKTTHSQMGVESGHRIAGTNWFTHAVQGAMNAAQTAYEVEFNNEIKKIA